MTTSHSIPPRLFRYVEVSLNGCLTWKGRSLTSGYGRFYHKGKRWRAHRFFYERLVGPIPDSLELDHLCRNRLCVNHRHLEAVTHAENVRRGEAGKHSPEKPPQTHCKRGHEMAGRNLVIMPAVSRGRRYTRRKCRACHNLRDRLYSRRR